MIPRTARKKIRPLAAVFPAVAVIGPSSVWETTLVRTIFPDLPSLLLEDPDTRRFAEEDPRGFLGQYRSVGVFVVPDRSSTSFLANDCGIRNKTAQDWISLLETSFIFTLIRPHHKKFNKHLIRMPQISFTDPGLASYLIGIRSPGEVKTHPMKGGLCETLILGEFLKYRYNKGEESNLFFLRDKTGHEIDCLIEHA